MKTECPASRFLALAAVSLAVLSAGIPAPGAPPIHPPEGEALKGREGGLLELAVRSPDERKGDYDALAASWLEALPARASDFRGELLARRLLEILPFVRDPRALIPRLEGAIAARYEHGSIREALIDVLAQLYQSAGREADLERLAAGRGHIRRWRVIGPFGKGKDSLFRRPFPPETDLRPPSGGDGGGESGAGRKHRDGWQELEWLPAKIEAPDPTINPFRHIYPAAGVAYLLAQVRSEKEMDALLERASSATIRIWLNGSLVAEDDAASRFLESRRSTPVRLRAGWNRILVKTATAVQVRLADPGGNPFPEGALAEETGETIHEIAGAEPAPPASAPPRPIEAWESWVRELEAGAAEPAEPAPAQPNGRTEKAELADARAGLGLLYLESGRYALAVEQAEKAVALLPQDPMLLFHAGHVYRNAGYLPPSISKNRAKGSFEAALEKDPELLPANERVARFLEIDEQYSKAARKAREAVEKDPTFLRGLLRLKSIYDRKGWKAEEIQVVREIEKCAPGSTVPPLFWGEHYAKLGNAAQALEHYRKASELDRRLDGVLRRISELEVERGNLKAAEEALREAVRREPADLDHGNALFSFLDRTRRHAEALELARELAVRRPQDPRGLKRIAELNDVLGNPAEAAEAYRRALALEPGDLSLRRYLAARQGEASQGEKSPADAAAASSSGGPGGETTPPGGRGGEKPRSRLDEYWLPYDEKLEDWSLTIPTEGPLVAKAAAIMVLDITVVRIEPDGSYSEYVHQAYKLLSEESKDDLADVSTQGTVLVLRTISPAGEVLEPVAAEGKNSYVMPGLAEGALIEFAYRNDQSRRQGRSFRSGPFFFQDMGFKHSALLSRFVILLPEGVRPGLIETNLGAGKEGGGRAAGLARVEKTVREADAGGTAIIYEARNAPRLEPESLLPSGEEYIPNVLFLEKLGWEDVAASLFARHAQATRPTPELRDAAAKIVAGKEDLLERAKAIHAHVNDLIPKEAGSRQAAAILLEKSGDRTILFKALCDLAGVPARWAYLRLNEALHPKTDWSYPRPEMFPYPYVAIEVEGKEPVYVSLSQRWTPFGRLPEHLEGGKAIILRDGGEEKITLLPRPAPEESAATTRASLELGEALDVTADVEMGSRSVSFYAAKDQIKTVPAFQKDLHLRQIANSMFPGAKVEKAEFRGLDDPEKPFSIAIKASAPKFLRKSGDRFLLKPILQPANLVRSFGGRSVREHPAHFRMQRVIRDSIRVEPGDAYVLERPPEGVTLAGALGTYSLAYRVSGGSVSLERELTLLPGRLSPEEFPAFVEFCEKVDAAETESLVFRKK